MRSDVAIASDHLAKVVGSAAWNRRWVESTIQRLTTVKCGKLKYCSGCDEWKNPSAYSATVQAAVAAAKHIMNKKHLCLVCKAPKEKETCGVCKNKVDLDEL